jgi:hypothetical protein
MPSSKTGNYEVRRGDTPGLLRILWISPAEPQPLLMTTITPERVRPLYDALGEYLRADRNGEHPARPHRVPADSPDGHRGPNGEPPS